MTSRASPDPRTDIVSIRMVASRAACLLPKGVGERVVLREATRLFEVLCPGLPRVLARGGKALVQAEILARRPVPVPEGMEEARPPGYLLAALSTPLQPGDPDRVPGRPGGHSSARAEARPARLPTRAGHLRVIQGGGR